MITSVSPETGTAPPDLLRARLRPREHVRRRKARWRMSEAYANQYHPDVVRMDSDSMLIDGPLQHAVP